MSLGSMGGIHKKVDRMLKILKKEGDELTTDLGKVTRIVSRHSESADRSTEKLVDCCEGNMKKIYTEVSNELDRIDEDVTIIGVTMDLDFTDDDIEVVVVCKDYAGLSSPSKYLVRKLQGRLTRLQRDIKILTAEVNKTRQRVHRLVEESEQAAVRIFEVGDTDGDKNVLKLFKEFSKCIGSADTEITLLRISLPNFDDLTQNHEIFDHSLENETKNAKEVDRIVSSFSVTKDIVDSLEVINNDHNIGTRTTSLRGSEITRVNEHVEKKGKEFCSQTSNFDNSKYVNNSKENTYSVIRVNNSSTNVKSKLRADVGMKEKPKQEVNSTMDLSSSDKKNPSRKNKTKEKSNSMVKKSPSYEVGNSTHPITASTSIVETHRRQQLDLVKKKLKEYGEPLMVGEYNKFLMTFDSGCPALFWIFANTEALWELQAFIQRMARGKVAGDGGGPGVGVGSLVLARYSVDNALYRAKVEDIIDEELFSVRYIDYGNCEDCLLKSNIYSWDKILEQVPPQAVSCTFYRAEQSIIQKTNLTIKEMESFSLLMKQSSPMQMVVHKRNSLPLETFKPNVTLVGPELSVALRGKDGQDILDKLGKLPAFSLPDARQKTVAKKSKSSSATVTIPTYNVVTPTYKAIKELESLQSPTQIHPVPTPLHLQGDDHVVMSEVEDPPSPVHPRFTSRAVEKVMSWLGQKDGVEDEVLKEIELPEKCDSPDQSRVTGQAPIENNNNMEDQLRDANMNSTTTEQVTEPELGENLIEVKDITTSMNHDPVTTVSSIKVTKKEEPSNVVPVCDDELVLCNVVPGHDTEPPEQITEVPVLGVDVEVPAPSDAACDCETKVVSLTNQHVEEDEHGEFQFLMSHIISPDEMYVHPVTEVSCKMTELEEDLGGHAESQEMAKKEEIIVGSVWAVQLEMWYRVKVLKVMSSKVELQLLDHGHHVLVSKDDLNLHHLHPGLAGTLPCLAVRCHLAGVRPALDSGWGRLAMQMMNTYLEAPELQHTAVVMNRDQIGGSVGIAITLERQGMFSTVNQRLVEVGCAISSVFGSPAGSDNMGVGYEGDSGMVNDWDPMRDSNSTITNYMSENKGIKDYVPG